jgi:hypothetical protein
MRIDKVTLGDAEALLEETETPFVRAVLDLGRHQLGDGVLLDGDAEI